jgi:hypothetical protein
MKTSNAFVTVQGSRKFQENEENQNTIEESFDEFSKKTRH